MKLLFSILIAFCTIGLVSGQEALTELQRIYHTFQDGNTISFPVKYVYYPTHDATVPIDSLSGFTCINGNDFYYRVDQYEYLNSEGYYISIINPEKEIIVSDYIRYFPGPFSISYLDSMMKSSEGTVSFFEPGDGNKGLRIVFTKGLTPKIEIEYDPHTYRILKTILFTVDEIDWQKKTATQNRLEISYFDYSVTKKSFPKDQYPVSKYLIVNRDKISLAPQYSSYHLNNNLSP